MNPYVYKKADAPKQVEVKKKIEQDFPTLPPQGNGGGLCPFIIFH